MKLFFLVLIAILIFGCVPNMTPPKKVLSSFQINNISIEWYSFSSAYADTPGFITAKSNRSIDTICISTNIASVEKQEEGVILIGFYGSPKKYSKLIEIPKKTFNINIITDTTFTFVPRKNKS